MLLVQRLFAAFGVQLSLLLASWRGAISQSCRLSVGSLLTSAGYTINTKHVQTQVKIENGGTLVIGGIYQEASSKSENKTPLLGDIPLLGYLFKRTDKSVSKTELLIFLTPYVLDGKGKPMPSNNTNKNNINRLLDPK